MANRPPKGPNPPEFPTERTESNGNGIDHLENVLTQVRAFRSRARATSNTDDRADFINRQTCERKIMELANVFNEIHPDKAIDTNEISSRLTEQLLDIDERAGAAILMHDVAPILRRLPGLHEATRDLITNEQLETLYTYVSILYAKILTAIRLLTKKLPDGQEDYGFENFIDIGTYRVKPEAVNALKEACILASKGYSLLVEEIATGSPQVLSKIESRLENSNGHSAEGFRTAYLTNNRFSLEHLQNLINALRRSNHVGAGDHFATALEICLHSASHDIGSAFSKAYETSPTSGVYPQFVEHAPFMMDFMITTMRRLSHLLPPLRTIMEITGRMAFDRKKEAKQKETH